MSRSALWALVAVTAAGMLVPTGREARAQGHHGGGFGHGGFGHGWGGGFGFGGGFGGFGGGGFVVMPAFGPPTFMVIPPSPLPSQGYLWPGASIDPNGEVRMRGRMGSSPPLGRRLAGPLPPADLAREHNLPAWEAPAARKVAVVKNTVDPAHARLLGTYGDRLFRGGNLKRAEERYEQALKAMPEAVEPRIRLAQVAICRGRYDEAARYLRDAIVLDPGWPARASDIRAIYGEPDDFNKQVARLESHLQTNPSDRDAWLVLGVQLYLSDRPGRAADVFLRLSDRKPDPALAALIDAATLPRVGH